MIYFLENEHSIEVPIYFLYKNIKIRIFNYSRRLLNNRYEKNKLIKSKRINYASYLKETGILVFHKCCDVVVNGKISGIFRFTGY